MQITLKQAEIATAVKQYIAKQGISLSGKSISVGFTATRSGNNGVIAEIDIEDNDNTIPGFTDVLADPVLATETKNNVATLIGKHAAVAAAAAEANEALNAPAVNADASKAEDGAAATAAAEVAAEGNSLFN